MNRRMAAASGLIALSVLPVSSQTSPNVTSFEVASVKPAPKGGPAKGMPYLNDSVEEQIRFRGGPGTNDPGRIDYSGVTLKMLLKRAYNVQSEQIRGPDWLETERYDIIAKVPPGANADQLRLMLKELLTERFQIQMHRETKTLPVYFLTIAKNGPKLQPPEKLPEYKNDEERKAAMQKSALELLDAATRQRGPHRQFHLPSATTARFAEKLASNLDRPVRHKTQLDGLYAFTLEWAPDSVRPSSDTPSAPSVFAAVEEQLGLRLQRGNEEFEVLVIDKAEKSPTSN